ncbi:hypothetical protein D3C86_1696660 [compost metagenome]
MSPGQPRRAAEGVIHLLTDHLRLGIHFKGTRTQVVVEAKTQLVVVQFSRRWAVPMQQAHSATAGLNAEHL